METLGWKDVAAPRQHAARVGEDLAHGAHGRSSPVHTVNCRWNDSLLSCGGGLRRLRVHLRLSLRSRVLHTDERPWSVGPQRRVEMSGLRAASAQLTSMLTAPESAAPGRPPRHQCPMAVRARMQR